MQTKQINNILVIVIFLMGLWLITGLVISLNPVIIWATSFALIITLLIYIGLGSDNNPKWYGVLLDKDRNRLSLSRLQITLWTIIIISAYMTVALIRSIPNALNELTEQQKELCAQSLSEECAPQSLNISFPSEVWVVLGISTVSFAGSSLIKINKRQQFWTNITKEDLNKPVLYHAPGAKFSDIFYGDDEGNRDSIDLSKVQMFFFTMVLMFAYAVAIGTLMLNKELLHAPLAFEFPIFSSSMTTILAISHAGYLIVKTPNQKIQGLANS
jgi:hypothetical protein